jgi:RHS repeat-associated protein
LIAIRFNKPMDEATLGSSSFSLIGPNGQVDIEAVSVEDSLLVFLNPRKDLQPGSQYTVFIKGVADPAHAQLPFTAFSFSTRSLKPSAVRHAVSRWADSEMWIPDPKNFGHAWVTGLPELPATRLVPKKAKAAIAGNSLTGRVLRMNGDPLAGVTLRLGKLNAITDQDGDFTIQGFDAGTQVLEIDGTTANRGDASYGSYLYRAVLSEGENQLPFPVWMQKLDPLGDRDIASPLDQEVVLTTPAIPGLEIHLPKGTVIRDRNGKVVTKVNVTAIPTDRPPFPLTTGDIPTYFTLQPGGAWISNVDPTVAQGAQIVYPNYFGWAPGAVANFWNYDPKDRGWYVYGQGHVNDSGRQVFPDPGVAIYEFTGAMIGGGVGLNLGPMDVPPGPPGPPPCAAGTCCGAPSGPPSNPPPGGGGGGGGGWNNDPPPPKSGCDGGGDPVSLSTGQFTQFERDLYLPDVMPIDLVRHYRSLDTNVRAFGLGMSNVYDVALWNTSTSGYADVDLVLPDGGRVHFTCTSSCTTYADAAYNTAAGGEWYMATLTRVNSRGGWSLVKRDGTEWFFPSFQPLKEIKDAAGNRTIITRRDNNGTGGPITRITSPNGRWIEFTVHSSGRITQAKDNGGRTFTYTYDPSYSRLLQVTDPNGGIRQYTWDATNNRIAAIYDPKGNRFVLNSYDANGRVASQTLADGSTFAYTYTLTSGVITKTQVTDRAGHKREVDFNSGGQVISDSYPVGLPEQQTSTFEYANGLQTASTDPAGRRTEYTYDARGNTASITSLAGTPQAQTTTFTYTSTGPSRLLSIDGPMPGTGDTTTYQWYPTGKLQRVTDPNGNYTRYEYDSQGRVTLIANTNEQAETYTYSGPDVSSVTDALGRTTSYFADSVGRTVSVTDAAGSQHLSEFDSMNRLVRSTAPDGSVATFQYDANGNMIGSTDERNNSTTYSVNSQGIAAGHTDPLGKSDVVSFDSSGRPTRFIDRMGQVSGVTYDARGRVVSLGFGASASAPTSYTSTITYSYKANTDLVEQVVDSSTGTIAYEYDALDRMTKETTPQGSVSYTYNPDGSRSSMTVLGQPTVQYAYDVGGRLRQMIQGTQAVTFVYDGANRRTSATLANGVVATYGHDAAGQLTSIAYALNGSAIGDLAYTYDVVGHRTSVTGSLAGVALPVSASAGAYDANNRLLGWNSQLYAYDDNGHLLSDGSNTYSWNPRGQLSSISGAVSATFAYDAIGRRISKTVSGNQTGFLYDGKTFVQELAGSTVKANILSAGLDDVVARTTSAGQASMLTDAIGSVIAQTNESGMVTSSFQFEPYGRATTTGSSDNTQTFTGREDDGTGLLYYRARYYMPGCGRFISEDPMGVQAGSNLYAYAGGDPINIRDPLGLYGCGMPSVADWWAETKQNYADTNRTIDGWFPDIPFTSMHVPGFGSPPKVIVKLPGVGSAAAASYGGQTLVQAVRETYFPKPFMHPQLGEIYPMPTAINWARVAGTSVVNGVAAQVGWWIGTGIGAAVSPFVSRVIDPACY